MHYTGEELEKLDLSDNPMTEEVAPALAEALCKQDKLVRLNLNDTSLKDEGIQAIAEVLCPTTTVCINVMFPCGNQTSVWQPAQGVSSSCQMLEVQLGRAGL